MTQKGRQAHQVCSRIQSRPAEAMSEEKPQPLKDGIAESSSAVRAGVEAARGGRLAMPTVGAGD